MKQALYIAPGDQLRMRRQGGSRVDDDVTESLTRKEGQTPDAKHIHATLALRCFFIMFAIIY